MLRQQRREKYGIVLDFLPHGHPLKGQRNPVAQVLGEDYFVLLEVMPKKDVALRQGDKVYLGPDRRDKIHHIMGKVNLSELTQTAKMELEIFVDKLVEGKKEFFIGFFNKAGPITMRLHQLELLPGVGKKHMWKILEERKEKQFESFEDIKKRIELIPDPKKLIIKRILEEMEGTDKYKLFVG
jgi:putative nucleotide binding protein